MSRHPGLIAVLALTLVPMQEARTALTEIWRLHQAGESQQVIDAVQPYIDDQLTPRDRRATCMFLLGDNQRRLGTFDAATTSLRAAAAYCAQGKAPTIDTPYGQAEIAPLCELGIVLCEAKEAGVFPEDSKGLTGYAWRFLSKGRNDLSISFAERCITAFAPMAKEQQAAHVRRYGTQVPKIEPKSVQEQEMWKEYWSLNDVGTCEFIIGLSCVREAQASKNRDDARAFAKKGIAAFESVVSDFSAAQCFDPQGPWYWRVRDGAAEQLPDLQRLLRSLEG